MLFCAFVSLVSVRYSSFKDRLYLSGFLFGEKAVDDGSEGAVAGDVASCTEAVHRDVECDHQGYHLFVETEDGLQEAD